MSACLMAWCFGARKLSGTISHCPKWWWWLATQQILRLVVVSMTIQNRSIDLAWVVMQESSTCAVRAEKSIYICPCFSPAWCITGCCTGFPTYRAYSLRVSQHACTSPLTPYNFICYCKRCFSVHQEASTTSAFLPRMRSCDNLQILLEASTDQWPLQMTAGWHKAISTRIVYA